MKRGGKQTILSASYWFGAHSLGLLLHPYQSMRRICRQGVFVPLVMLPSVLLVGWWVLGVVVARVSILAKLGLPGLAGELENLMMARVLMYGVFVWGGVYLLMWQGLLLYLYWRFSKVAGLKKGVGL